MSAGDVWFSYGDERFVELERDPDVAGEFALKLRDNRGSVRWYGVPEIRERGIALKCIDCDEGRGTCPGGRCRECDLGYLLGYA